MTKSAFRGGGYLLVLRSGTEVQVKHLRNSYSDHNFNRICIYSQNASNIV